MEGTEETKVLAALGGHFAGDGSVSFVGLVVKATQPDVLVVYERMFGGTLSFCRSNDASRKDTYCWRIARRSGGLEAARKLLPYSMVKRSDLKVFLNLHLTQLQLRQELTLSRAIDWEIESYVGESKAHTDAMLAGFISADGSLEITEMGGLRIRAFQNNKPAMLRFMCSHFGCGNVKNYPSRPSEFAYEAHGSDAVKVAKAIESYLLVRYKRVLCAYMLLKPKHDKNDAAVSRSINDYSYDREEWRQFKDTEKKDGKRTASQLERECTKCKMVKGRENFHLSKVKLKSGEIYKTLRSKCKKCKALEDAARHKRNKINSLTNM